MKYFSTKFLIVFLFSITFSISAQTSDELWTKSNEIEQSKSQKVKRKSSPKEFGLYKLNLKEFISKLKGSVNKKHLGKSGNILSFPNGDGKLENYEVFEASIMEKELQNKFPNIKSYIGKGLNNSSSRVRFSVTSLGLHAMISPSKGNNIYIDPFTSNKESYIVYSKKNLQEKEKFECLVSETKTDSNNKNTLGSKNNNADDGILRTYRLAVATTGEYSQFQIGRANLDAGATDEQKKEAVLSAINVTMTRVNEVFERDLAIRMVLVANNLDVIFLDAETDGFTNDDGNVLINESQTVIDNRIGDPNYDIGHTFSTGGGGLAELKSPCSTGRKARGITGSGSPTGDPFDIDYVAHEMGHQFGAHHTFNSDAGNCGDNNRNDGTAVEPGSGTTIMAYAGICSPDNVQNNSDAYFHLVSIREIWNNITIGTSTCGVQTTTNNNAPVLEPLSNYTMPISTPFVLNTTATDIDGDDLEYTWEQLDTEITTYPLVSTATGGPAFRSVKPSRDSMRYFPNQETIIGGELKNTWEVLPTVERTMRFGITVRDNNIAGGQTSSEELTITFDASSGPFKLTSQTESEIWTEGTSQTVTWDVANTNNLPVNCAFVNILLSLDGGLTFPVTLASKVPNDGSHLINVPGNSTTSGRIKIESFENVFYTMNIADLTIQSSEFVMNFDSFTENICSPNSIVYTFTYNTFLGFNETTAFSVDNLPTGAVANFTPASATNDNTMVSMTISNIMDDDIGNYNIMVSGNSTTVSKTTALELNVYSSTINAPTIIGPEDNTASLLKPYLLKWDSSSNALNYEVQISEDFGFSTIYESANIGLNTYTPQLLQLNTKYFWRVKSINDCGESDFSQIYNFTTANEVCDTYIVTSKGISIPDNNSTGVNSIINVADLKTITDVNVTVNITHPWIEDLNLSLISPQGTTILLSANNGGDGDNYTDTIFDDDGTDVVNTGVAPFTGVFKPQGLLSNFNNEDSLGDWTLKVVDSGPGDVGVIDSWSIEVCGVAKELLIPSDNFNIEVISETCPGKNNGQLNITSTKTYNYSTSINGVNYGFTNNLSLSNLNPGMYDFCIGVEGVNFEQCFSVEILNGTTVSGKTNISNGNAEVEIIYGTAPYTIVVNENEVFETSEKIFDVNVEYGDVLEIKTAVKCEGVFSKTIENIDRVIGYPNPTTSYFNISLPKIEKELKIEVYTIQGQLISSKFYTVNSGNVQLNLNHAPTGIYIAKIHLKQPVNVKIIKQ